MKKKKKNNGTNNLLPFSVIMAAANGDVIAINAVLRFYSAYIAALATRPFFDRLGQVHMTVDHELKNRLETRLITRILKFKIA